MGVSDVLPRILESSGRLINLRDFKDGVPNSRQGYQSDQSNAHPCTTRPLRVGIDVLSWIYTAGHAFSDKLGDERHLTNHGRANLVEEQQLQKDSEPWLPAEDSIREYVSACTYYVMKRLEIVQTATKSKVLVVLDGRSPPIKAKEVARRRQISKEHKAVRQDPRVVLGSPTTVQAANERRTKANKRAGPGPYISRILESLVDALRVSGKYDNHSSTIAYLVAPFEADAQLAYMARKRFIDVVITEDSDLIAHGAPCILYKCVRHINDGDLSGILWQYKDIGALPLGYSTIENTSVTKAPRGSTINLLDFTPAMMATLFVLLGCDYTCGEQKKLKGIGLVTGHKIIRKAFFGGEGESNKEKTSVLSVVWNEAYRQAYTANTLTPEFKRSYERTFIEALFMYRHPVVFDPILKKCFRVDQYDLELMEHPAYAKLYNDRLRIASVVGEIPPDDEAVDIAEGRINWRAKKPTTLGVLSRRVETDPLDKDVTHENENQFSSAMQNSNRKRNRKVFESGDSEFNKDDIDGDAKTIPGDNLRNERNIDCKEANTQEHPREEPIDYVNIEIPVSSSNQKERLPSFLSPRKLFLHPSRNGPPSNHVPTAATKPYGFRSSLHPDHPRTRSLAGTGTFSSMKRKEREGFCAPPEENSSEVSFSSESEKDDSSDSDYTIPLSEGVLAREDSDEATPLSRKRRGGDFLSGADPDSPLQAPESSSNTTSTGQEKSPNLLASSSTPERTQSTSKRSTQTLLDSASKSPNLLASTTSDVQTTSQSQDSLSKEISSNGDIVIEF